MCAPLTTPTSRWASAWHSRRCLVLFPEYLPGSFSPPWSAQIFPASSVTSLLSCHPLTPGFRRKSPEVRSRFFSLLDHTRFLSPTFFSLPCALTPEVQSQKAPPRAPRPLLLLLVGRLPFFPPCFADCSSVSLVTPSHGGCYSSPGCTSLLAAPSLDEGRSSESFTT